MRFLLILLFLQSHFAFAVEYKIYSDTVVRNYPIQGQELSSVTHDPKHLQAVVIGAGIAGLTSALVLLKEGYEVVVLEKRSGNFDRLNMINLKFESESFLQQLELFEDFNNKDIGVRLTSHFYYHLPKGEESVDENTKPFHEEDVSSLKVSGPLRFEIKDIKNLFSKDGLYTITIAEFQQFLAEHAMKRGAFIVTNVNVEIDVKNKNRIKSVQNKIEKIFAPDLIVLANGNQSDLKISDQKTVKNHPCQGEKWIFGNVKYSGKNAFVYGLLDYSKEDFVQISNVIFNPKLKEMNISVSVQEDKLDPEEIKQRIQKVARQALFLTGDSKEAKIQFIYPSIVKVQNRIAEQNTFSDNMILVGDQAGSSSPLAGLGATLATTSYPYQVRQIALSIKNGKKKNIKNALKKYQRATKAFINKWFDVSAQTKKQIESLRK